MRDPHPSHTAYIESIKAALNSALQVKAKKSEFVTQHVAGIYLCPRQLCARCGKIIAVIGDDEPFSFPVGVAIFEDCLGEMDTKPRTLFIIPCHRLPREHVGVQWAIDNFLKP